MENEETVGMTSVKSRLEDKVRLNVAVIGIGNAGNQIIEAAIKEHYNVFAVNSSTKDLSNMILSEQIPAFIIGDDARGAGQNRAAAKTFFRENGDRLFSDPRFLETINPADIIFVVGATAGGTGSGVAPEICHILHESFEKKIVIYYGILPKIGDAYQAHTNTVECVSEVQELKIPYMLADLSFFENVSKDIAYREVANQVITSINTISGKYLNYSSDGMIDENDMRVIVREPGYMATYALNELTHQMLDKQSVQTMMIDRIKNSAAAAIMRDGIVKQMGIISNFPEELAENVRSGNFSELTAYTGRPFAVFENFSSTQGALGQFILILSGMTLPYSRIKQSSDLAKEGELSRQKQKDIDLKADLANMSATQAAIAAGKDFFTKKEVPAATEKKMQDVLSGYFNK